MKSHEVSSSIARSSLLTEVWPCGSATAHLSQRKQCRRGPGLTVAACDKRVAVGAGLIKVAAEGADERRLWQVNVAVNLRWLDVGDDRGHVCGDLTNNAKPQEAFFFGGQNYPAISPRKRGRARSWLLA